MIKPKKIYVTQMILSLLLIIWTSYTYSQEIKYRLDPNVSYYSESIQGINTYQDERCVLDLYYPENKKSFATVVWFHGGGLTGGEKEIPSYLKNKGIAVAAVNYRLNPKVKSPVYVEDAAAAVAWILKNIDTYGGDPKAVFISGHSAGGYLASMVGLDKKYLKAHDLDANQIAGLIPFSGHTITHFTIRQERGIEGTQPIIDDMAPLYHVRPDAPPLLLITGDRDMELLGRYEENAYMMRMMKVVGHKETNLLELKGYGHSMTYPAFPLLIDEINRILKNNN